MEFKHRKQQFFAERDCDSADVVFGGDHGARRFRAVIHLILRNSRNNNIDPLSVVITIGNIDCTKDSWKVLESTIATHLNESLHNVVGKYFVIYYNGNEPIFTFADEPPAVLPSTTSFCFWFKSRTFITGDLAFLATALGKENHSTCWCNWCRLSPKEWAPSGHEKGDLWMIQKINDVRDLVADGKLDPHTPGDIKGCTERPLFDSVPVENYILSLLHIIIGMGNTLVDSFLAWIDQWVEKLEQTEIDARKNTILEMLKLENLVMDFADWQLNDGITLSETQIEKQGIKHQMTERVSPIFYISNLIINFTLFLFIIRDFLMFL